MSATAHLKFLSSKTHKIAEKIEGIRAYRGYFPGKQRRQLEWALKSVKSIHDDMDTQELTLVWSFIYECLTEMSAQDVPDMNMINAVIDTLKHLSSQDHEDHEVVLKTWRLMDKKFNLTLVRPSIDAYLTLLSVNSMDTYLIERIISMAQSHTQLRKVFERAVQSLQDIINNSNELCQALLFHPENLISMEDVMKALCTDSGSSLIGYQKQLIIAAIHLDNPKETLPKLLECFIHSNRASVNKSQWFTKRSGEFYFFKALVHCSQECSSDTLAELLRVIAQNDVLSSANDTLYKTQLEYFSSLLPAVKQHSAALTWLTRIDLRIIEPVLSDIWALVSENSELMHAILDSFSASGRFLELIRVIAAQSLESEDSTCLHSKKLLQSSSDSFAKLTNTQKTTALTVLNEDSTSDSGEKRKKTKKSACVILTRLFVHRLHADDKSELWPNFIEMRRYHTQSFLEMWMSVETLEAKSSLAREFTQGFANCEEPFMSYSRRLQFYEIISGSKFVPASVAFANTLNALDRQRFIKFWNLFDYHGLSKSDSRQLYEDLKIFEDQDFEHILKASNLLQTLVRGCGVEILLELSENATVIDSWIPTAIARSKTDLYDIGNDMLRNLVLAERVRLKDSAAIHVAETMIQKGQNLDVLLDPYLSSIQEPLSSILEMVVTAVNAFQSKSDDHREIVEVACKNAEKLTSQLSINDLLEFIRSDSNLTKVFLSNLSTAGKQEVWQLDDVNCKLQLLKVGHDPSFKETLQTLKQSKDFNVSSVLSKSIVRQKLSHHSIAGILQLLKQVTGVEQKSALLTSLLKYQPGCSKFIPLFVIELINLMSQMRMPVLTDDDFEKQSSCLVKLTTVLTAHGYKNAIKKHSIILLTCYITTTYSTRPYILETRSNMTEIAYLLLNTCGEHEKNAVIVGLDSTGKSLLKSLYTNYTKFYKFTGQM